MSKSVYITYAKRSAIGAFLGNFAKIPAPKIGEMLVRNLLSTLEDKNIIDELIFGQVLTGGSGQNPARQTLINAGMDKNIPALTINKVCGSGLKSVALAANSILSGENDIVITGGQENMSLALHGSYIRSARIGNVPMIDLMQYDGLTDVFSGVSMGITAENIAKEFNISRLEQDEFAFHSQEKAANAQDLDYFKNEIVPIEVNIKKEIIKFINDESVRRGLTIDNLAKLKPAFEQNGTVTAGNSSSINDGASCLLVVSEKALKKHKLTPLVRIVSYASSGVDPNIMGTGPVPASRKALEKAGWNIADLDLIEANEAFAAQAIYVNKQMEWDSHKVNICGGAIALGHPIGASGGRILVTLINQMKRLSKQKGLATLCIGGGMGIAMCVELVE